MTSASIKTSRAVILLAVAMLAFGCGNRDCKPCSDIAEPVEPPSYGEEESNVEVWLDTLEVGSRELYAAREAVVEAVNIPASGRIADIGAGTGLYTLLFAQATGPDGVVYAVDIEPRFLKLINQRAADLDLMNVVSVLGHDNDITLPAGSADVVFIADTYHYFSDPAVIMASVREALKPDGRLVILDYALETASADAQGHDHVRVGKEGVLNEVQSFGFRLTGEPKVEGLTDIYMIVFAKDAR